MGTNRPKLPSKIEQEILVKSARRCCLCYGLSGDSSERVGQIAHLDVNRANNNLDNLAFMCLEHHNTYDSKTSQSKNYTISEAKHYRDKLYVKVACGEHLCQSSPPRQGVLEVIDLDFLETRAERRRPEEHSAYSLFGGDPARLGFLQEWVADPHPKPGELPVLDIKLRNSSPEVAFIKQAVFEVLATWEIEALSRCFSEVKISANYDISFGDCLPGHIAHAKISQSVPPNGVDRFTLTLHAELTSKIILANMKLIYNSAGKELNAGDILFSAADYDSRFRTIDDEQLFQKQDQRVREVYLVNNKAKTELQTIKAIRSNAVRAFESGKL